MAVEYQQFNCKSVNIIVQTKKPQWSASLCHSLVPHTSVELSLRFKLTASFGL